MQKRRSILATLVLTAATGVAAALAHATGPGKNGLIAYASSGARIWVVAPDGSGLRKLTTEKGPQVDDWNPDWSPDGSKVAVEHCQQRCEVWTIAANGAGFKRLGCRIDCGMPAWSPNGKLIAVGCGWGGVQHNQIKFAEVCAMNANGTGFRQLTHVTTGKPFSADVERPAWSPDGKQIAFAVHNSQTSKPAGGRAVFVTSADGSNIRQLTPWELNGGGKLDWSPDGALILFRSISRIHQEHGNLYTIHPDGTGVKRLTNYPEPKTVDTGSFSPDGNWIVFSRFTNAPYPSIFTMRANGGGVRQVVTTKVGFGWVGFVPDWGTAA